MAETITGFLIKAVISFAISKALSFVTGALFGKPQPQRGVLPTFQTRRIERRVTARSTDEAKHFVFGEALVSGPLVLFEGSGADKKFLHTIVPFSFGQCDLVTDVLLNDETVGALEADGDVTEGRFVKDTAVADRPDPESFFEAALGLFTPAAHPDPQVRIKTHLGSLAQVADADAVANVADWTTAHRGRGVTYGYGQLEFSTKVWPNSFNRFSARVRGWLMYDPREAGVSITSSTAADPAVFATSAAHGLAVGNQAWLKGHTGAVITDPKAQNFGDPGVDKEYEVNTVPTTTTFTLLGWDGQPLALSTGGAGGTVTRMRWSDNWALCVRRWLAFRQGLNIPNDDIVDSATNAAANVSDEQVALTAEAVIFTADPAKDELTLVSRVTWKTGDGVTLTTTGTLPAGLALATTYFVIRLAQGRTNGKILLATTLANARALIFIDITDAGTGTHTITRNSQLRYTCNGVIVLDQGPLDTLEDLYTAGAGMVIDTGEGFEIHAGAAVSPSGTLDESDMAGGVLQDTTYLPMSDSFNAARGTYFDPDKFDTRLDLPPFTNATFESEDGGRVYQDFEFPFTSDPVAGQRLLKIALERNRRGAILRFPAKPQKFEAMPLDVDQITLDFLGYSAADFRVQSTKLNPDFSINITYREEATAMWDWALGDETLIPLAPVSNLPDPFDVSDPTGLALASGTAQLFVRLDGTVFSRIKISWTLAPDVFVQQGGHVDVQFKKSADTDWEKHASTPGNETFTHILDVEDGVAYDVRIRFINSLGVDSDWVSVLAHVVVGKTAVPANVTGFSAQQNGNVVTFKWDQVADADLAGYEIRYTAQGAFVWGSATVLTKVTRGTLVTNAALPPGAQTVAIKAVDTTGNESVTEATFNITVTTGDVKSIKVTTEDPRWAGTLTGFVRHDVSDRLVPKSQDLASGNDFIVFDNFVVNPVANCFYEGAEIDIGTDALGVRVFAEFTAALGPGETTGVADPIFQIDHRKTATAYDGFEDWTVGIIDARFIKPRAKIATATGVAYLEKFKHTVDVAERIEKAEGVIIAIGGTAVTFANTFIVAPNIQVTADATTALFPVKSAVTTTGFTVKIFDSGGADVGGTVDWLARGG